MLVDQGQATDAQLQDLKSEIRARAKVLGFQAVGFTGINLGEHEARLKAWLANGFHGEMDYMAAHGNKRSRPAELEPGTLSVIALRMDYLVADTQPVEVLESSDKAYVARYTLGRDYHKLIRKRLVKLTQQIRDYLDDQTFHARVFTDSAPILEKAIAQQAGLGWIGKNTLLLNRDAGSWFFLGEIFIDLPIPPDPPQPSQHCGSCTKCMDVCPTDAFAGPYQLDARKCISYLTIEHRGTIDPALRAGIGNRIFGCDDCQIYCPWTKFAQITEEADFTPRHQLDSSDLLVLFAWSEAEFLKRTEGSAIRRTGHQGWQRNIAVALGNADYQIEIIQQLQAKLPEASDLVAEHIRWAIVQQEIKSEERLKKF